MKHLYTLLAVGTLSVLSLSAQSKIDLQGRILLEKINNDNKRQTELTSSFNTLSTASPEAEVQKISKLSTIVVLNDGFTAADLEAAGYEVTSDLRSVALVKVNSSDVEKMAELDCVRQISFGRQLEKYIDNARVFGGIDQLHSGIEVGGQTYTFTGKGVCTGIYDTGIEANHVNFLNDDGTTRIKQLQHYYEDEEGDLYRHIYSDPTQFTTDDEEETHGTHTTGIMAGGYKGSTKYINAWQEDDGWHGEFPIGPNPYYGVSTESDLLISAGVLEDAASIDGFERMAAYAKENGQPCVINYSIGSIIGPHDGTDAFSKAVSEIVNEYGAIICMAAGNSGGDKCSIAKTFTASDKSLKTCLTPNSNYSSSQVATYIDFWADDDTPFTLTLGSFKPKFIIGSDSNVTILTISQPDQSFNVAHQAATNVTKNSDLASHYSKAQIIAISEVDPNNNRYHVMGLVTYTRSATSASFLHINIEAQEGKTVVGTLSQAAEFTAQSKISGSVNGNDANSISDGACNPDVISVGAYNNRTYYATLGGSVSSYKYDEGDYSVFSSYGTTNDGREVPEVLGPGFNLLSSYSSYYVAKGYSGETSTDMSAEATVNGKTHYWACMSGTSMASPFVAGTIALWLEADPTLTVNDIHQLIATTSTKDELLESSEGKTGFGRINAVAGIQEILGRSLAGLGNVNADDVDRNLIIDQQQGTLSAFLAGETSLTATLFSASGLKVAEAHASDSNVALATESLTPGIYVLRIEGGSGLAATRKVIIR